MWCALRYVVNVVRIFNSFYCSPVRRVTACFWCLLLQCASTTDDRNGGTLLSGWLVSLGLLFCCSNNGRGRLTANGILCQLFNSVTSLTVKTAVRISSVRQGATLNVVFYV